MKFAHALLCALGLSLAFPAPLYAQEEAIPTTTYEWTTFWTNETDPASKSITLGISNENTIYANTQRGFAGSFTLTPEAAATADAIIFQVTGDGSPSKTVTFSITSAGKYQLATQIGGTSATEETATSTTAVTPGLHRFALLIRRGDSSSTNLIKHVSIIIDGAETLTLSSTTASYSSGPFRSIQGGSSGITLSASIWTNTVAAPSTDAAEDTLLIEADAAQMYPIAETTAVAWSNLDDRTNPKALPFTKTSSLQLTPLDGVTEGQRVLLTAVKFYNNSTKTMESTITINGVVSEASVVSNITAFTGSTGDSTYTFNRQITYAFPVGRRPIVTIGTSYDIGTSNENNTNILPAVKADGPITITGLANDSTWAGYKAFCAVEGLVDARVPEATVANVEVTVAEGFTGGGVISVELSHLYLGAYENELTFELRFKGVAEAVVGTRTELSLTFDLPAETFVPGRVYRGELVLVYPDGEIPLAPVKVYEGTPTLVTEAGWVNETVGSLGSTGTWTAAEGIAPYKEALEVDANGDVVFAPTEHVDYAATCDSTWTVQLVADEAFAASAESNPSAEVQGAVRIAADSTGALKVQVWKDSTWENLCAATEGETYTVTVDFHYAKSEAESDTITYTCGTSTLSGARPAGSAQVVTAVSVSDGTQLAALTAERELDRALVNQVTVTAGGEVQDLGETLPERIIVSGTFGYGKHPLLTYSGTGDLAAVPVKRLPSTAETYIVEGENGVKTWGIAEKTLVIYPVGDSITYGASRRLKTPANVDIPVPGGYRLPLYTRLTSAGYTVKYVGDTNSNPAEGLNGQLYHSGHAGWKVDDGNSIYDNVTGWSTTVKNQAGRDPDVILLLLGVNDLNGGEAAATTAAQMKKLIWRLAGIGPAVADDTPLYPNAKLLLGKVLDSTYATSSVSLETLSTRIGEYNTALAEFVNGLTEAQGNARIRLVDLKTPLDEANGFNYFRYDNLHPAAEGYTQMARNWFAAVEDFLPPLNQAESATVRVTESVLADQITLTFSKAMAKEAAETASNYTLTNGTVSAATLLDDGLTVRLTLTGTTPGAEATLTVAAMADKAGVQSTEASLPVRIGAAATRTTDIADSVCNRTAAGYTNPLELIAEWSAFTNAPTAEAGLPAQFGAARRAERPWVLKTLRGTPTVENGLLCLNGGTVTVEVNPDFVTHLTASDETSKNLSNKYWTLLIETVGDVGTNTVLGTMRTTGGTDAYADLYGLRTGANANTVTIVNAGVDAAVSGFADGSEYAADFSRNRNQFVFTFGASASSSSTGSYEAWVNSRAVAFSSTDAQKFYSKQTPLNFTFGGTYLTTSAEAAAFTQGSTLKIARIAICLGRANGDILTSSRYRFDPVAPATDTDWSNTSNWETYGASAGDLPPETETVYTAPGVTATMDQADTVANLIAEGPLTLAGANALTVSGDLSIPGTLTVNTTGGVSAAMLKTTGAREVAGTGTLTITDVSLGNALTVSGNLVWNASATTERSVNNAVKVTSTGSLTTTGKLKLNADSNELLGTTTVQSGILTVKTESQKIGGTLTIAKDGTFKYGQANVADALNYGGKATVNVYGTLEMNNTRWSLGSNNTLNFYPGATVNAGLQTQDGKQYGAFDASATQTINFKADANDGKSKGGEITFNATLRARENITLNVAEGVIVNFSGGRSYEQGDVGNANGKYGDTKAIAKTGDGLMKVSSAMRFSGTCSGPIQVAEGGTLKLTAAGNNSDITVDERAKLVLDCTTADSNTGNLNNKKVITNNGTVELANGHTWVSINGGKTEVTGTFVFGFGIAGTNDNVFKTNLKIADGASLTLCGHRNTSAELTGLKNLGTLVRNIWGAGQAPDVGIKMLTGSTMSGTGEIQVNASAEAGVTLDASESKALTFSRGLTLAGPLAVKVPEAQTDLCTIQGTIPEVTAFTFAEGSTIGGDHCFVLQGGSVLQALKKVTLPAESEQSETLSEAITRALEDQVRNGATTVMSIIATEAGGSEANVKRSTEAAELFTNVISATEVSDSEVAVKVSYDFSVSQMTIVNESDGSQTLLLCAKVSNVPQGSDGNSADYAKGTVVSVHRNAEDTHFTSARELTAEDRAAYGVTLGQGEKWFAVPLDACAGQTTTFHFSAAKEAAEAN